MKIGVVGYGTGGQHFHTPFIAAAKNCHLAGIVARAPQTVAKVRADWPDTPIYSSLSEMIAAGLCDAVTITTPPQTRRALVLEAIAAGLHVVADKPFAPDAAGGAELTAAAEARGVTLGVFQNRRLDADLQTLRKLIADGRLGRVWRIHNRMDFDDPATLEPGPTGGLLRDLGSHLVDQMLYLNGPVQSVFTHLDHVDLPEGRTNASFTLTLNHENGTMSEVSATKLNHYSLRELRAYGDKGAYVSHSTDVQAQSIFAGKRPAEEPETWGYEPQANWGTLYNAEGATRIPSEQGRYHDYYEAFAQAVRDGTPPPVSGTEGTRVLAVLDAARESAETGRSVTL
ncbi:Gfo/Idh/MocA family oxidoreductase [Mameliella alba]|nr:Gfo/Idh/MocA family oxidoreductase [Antarctobacter heliothermus]MBY6146659.1 Gfo/Idh/MocA family oxidoreductase [Mameliella alba]MBY6163607.1 Gfo/Idh/MocA family oxidoreductase [Mameliella alba]MBY6172062.1 Gfo/Idh/MocA family oxidoreductase [Mameliella alba]MBY6177095.1 Gfo/Idh/MocA family oxidoreductase [Mameliella alba]